MQSYQGDEIVQALVGEPATLVKQMPKGANHHVIGALPDEGKEVVINGLVWVVERIRAQHGWMRLRLKRH